MNTLNDFTDELIERLLATAENHFREGERYLQAGTVSKARTSFNAAVSTITSAEPRLQSAPRVQEYSKSLVRRIGERESAHIRSSGAVPEINAAEETSDSDEETSEQPREQALIDEVQSLNSFPIVIDPELLELVGEDIANTAYDIPVVVNERVLQFLNYFQTRGRDHLQEGLMRSGRYKDVIISIFDEEGLPRDLMYLALIESMFKPLAYSRAHAKGIWQFVSGTAKWFGLRRDRWIDERSDTEKSTRAAAKFIKYLYNEFGDWYLAMAGYNAGHGAVQRAIARSGSQDYWALAEKRFIPRETANYVPAILAGIIIAKNPERYGFATELEPPLALDRVKVVHPTDLKLISKLSNVPLETLRSLNPELTSMSTPRNYPEYELKLPADTGHVLMASLSRIPPQKRLTATKSKAVGSRKTRALNTSGSQSKSPAAVAKQSAARKGTKKAPRKPT